MPRISLALACIGGLAVSLASASAQTVLSGRIITPMLHMPAHATPVIALQLRGGNTDRTQFEWLGPQGAAVYQTYGPRPPGKSIFGAYDFPRYVAAGIFKLNSLTVCGTACTTYTGATLSPLFPRLTLTVVNPLADTTPPVVTAGTILSSTVARTNRALLSAELTLQDDSSGIIQAELSFGSTRNAGFTLGGNLAHPVTATEGYTLLSSCRCHHLAAGTYPLTKIMLTDVAGNATAITDPGTLSSLFAGGSSITLSP